MFSPCCCLSREEEIKKYCRLYLKERAYLFVCEMPNLLLILVDIQGKVGVLSETIATPSKKNRHELDAIEHAPIFSLSQLYRITFGNGNIDKIKYQRNLQILAGFDNFTHMALINTVHILDKVRNLKTESKQLKADTSEMLNIKQDDLKSLKIQMQILLNVLERLKQSKEHFDGRLDKSRRIDNKDEL
jgi:hypothetical protein